MSDEPMNDKPESRTSDSADRILDVLRIAKMTSGSGEGISLFDALRRTNYASVRKEFEANDLVPLLHAYPELVDQWTLFCANKRCGGWWVDTQSRTVGWIKDVGRPLLVHKEILSFPSLEEAVAEFVVKELDDAYSLMTNPTLSWCGRIIPIVAMLVGAALLAIGMTIARKWLFKY